MCCVCGKCYPEPISAGVDSPDHDSRGIWVYHPHPQLCSYCLHHRPSSPVPFMTTISDHPPNYSDDKLPTVRVYSQFRTDYSLTICNGKVIIAPCNSSDPYQHWIKDHDKFSVNIKDEEGYSSFALVNKATGQALKHAIGVNYPAQLRLYDPNVCDKSVLWSMGRNEGGGYRAIRAAGNIRLNLDAAGDDGTDVVFRDWRNNVYQKWTITFY